MGRKSNSLFGYALIAAIMAACGGGGRGLPSGGADAPGPPASAGDASLSDLHASSVRMDQVFQPEVFNYTGTAGYLAREMPVTATASNPAASVVLNGNPATVGTISQSVPLEYGSNITTVSVTAEDGTNSSSYTLDVERQPIDAFSQSGYIKALNHDIGDHFGSALAVSGDTLAVVAIGEDSAATGINGDSFDNTGTDAGAVYVFRRDTLGAWVQEALIKPSNTNNVDEFGHAVALSGNTLAVSALREDSSATGIDGDDTDNSSVDSGAVYVFTRNETGSWTQQSYLKASNTGASDGFGASLALYGDTLAVGAPMEDSNSSGVDGDQADNSSQESGAVYVFGRDTAGQWSQQAYLKASNNDSNDRFGSTLGLTEELLVIGAPREASKSTGIDSDQANNSRPNAGAAYVFSRDDSQNWMQEAYLKASNTDDGDEFGSSLAVFGSSLVVAAPFEDSAGRGVGGVQNDNKGLNSGAAYVFARDTDGAWTQEAYIKSSNSDIQDQFGRSLALDGEFFVIAALDDSAATAINNEQIDNSSINSGAAYLFERGSNGIWQQVAFIKSSNPDSGDNFGSSVALDGSILAIGAALEDSAATGNGGDMLDNSVSDSGAMYVFE